MATICEAPSTAPLEYPRGGKRLRLFEVSLVIVVAFGNYFLSSLLILRDGKSVLPYFQGSRWAVGILHELIALCLLGYVLSRRSIRIRDLGLRWSLRDLMTGAGVAVASYATYIAGSFAVYTFHRTLFPSGSNGVTAREMFGHPGFMAIPFSLLNPFFEELIVRAYLMTEVENLTGSWALAAALSVVVQTSYHLYYGWVGALSLSFQFLVFSIYYARTRKATPIIFAHGFFDLWALARLW